MALALGNLSAVFATGDSLPLEKVHEAIAKSEKQAERARCFLRPDAVMTDDHYLLTCI